MVARTRVTQASRCKPCGRFSVLGATKVRVAGAREVYHVPYMPSLNATAELAVYRNLLRNLTERVGAEDRAVIYQQARNDHDALVCLLEEAPADVSDAISSLIVGYDDLISSLLN